MTRVVRRSRAKYSHGEDDALARAQQVGGMGDAVLSAKRAATPESVISYRVIGQNGLCFERAA